MSIKGKHQLLFNHPELENNCTFKPFYTLTTNMTYTCKNSLLKLICLTVILLNWLSVFCQPNTSIDLDNEKPKQYETRKLVSEKTGEKKFNYSRRLYQNTVTHYNYFFNANTKLNNIIARAKASFKDDFTQLLPFYNYTLDGTFKDKDQLDSIVYKCNAAILLHDLRNDWIDDVYLLLGKAYLFRKNFDSADHVFQYINYIYAPKDDGYDIPLGSNASNTNGVFTIATVEKKGLLNKISTRPASRNESFIWKVRNDLEQDKVIEASSLLSILKSDPNFPARLQTDLHEMIAYSFYKQQIYDSAAWHLERALDNAADIGERSRWEFLCGQLYKLGKSDSAAVTMFTRAVRHTIDPFMDMYARLNYISLLSTSKKENALQENLNELYKLAKRDKFENYRDIIYYTAALLQLQQKNTKVAINNLSKSIQYSVDNPVQKQKAFLLLADLYYDTKSFTVAYATYDSVQTNYISANEKEKVDLRKPALKTISENLSTIHLQDSLIYLSGLTETERMAAVKKIYRQLRKEQGLKDSSNSYFDNLNTNQANTNLFSNTNAEFYFSNSTVKLQGLKDFKSRWGNRSNTDNWRRESSFNKPGLNNGNIFAIDVDQQTSGQQKDTIKRVFSIEELLSKIPLTREKTAEANKLIANALYENGTIFQNKLEEYESAAASYDELLRRYPDFKFAEKATFNLASCYLTKGVTNKFDSLKTVLNTRFSDGIWAYKINKGEFLNGNDSTVTVTGFTKEYIARQYENIYNLFIEGNFEKAKAEKQIADQSFGNKFWTPQLLFIEAVYYIKQRQDSAAIFRLQHIVSKFATSPLAEKSKTMIDVLKRRTEIENYLTNLQIDRNEDSVSKRVELNTTDLVRKINEPIKKDTTTKITNPSDTKKIELKPVTIAPIVSANSFVFNTSDPHYVLLIFDKVDQVYSSEARNAFSRFNREKYYNQKIDISSIQLNTQYNIMLLGPFASAGDAVNYVDNTKPSTASRIIPWLTADKYKFSIISSRNLEIVKTNKDIGTYINFIKGIFPDKF